MRRGFLCSRMLATTSLFVFMACFSSADEWKARHDLVSHTGVLNLSQPPAPEEVFLPGRRVRRNSRGGWKGLKAWRNERHTLLRYNSAQYERADLAWTQHIFSQVQLLIWDRRLYDPEKASTRSIVSSLTRRAGSGPIDAVLIWHVYPNLGGR